MRQKNDSDIIVMYFDSVKQTQKKRGFKLKKKHFRRFWRSSIFRSTNSKSKVYKIVIKKHWFRKVDAESEFGSYRA